MDLLSSMTKQEKLKISIDRISDLPDDILSRILSFVPTKDAVRTSILSARWKCLFVSVPSLDFDDSLFLHPKRGRRNRDTSLQSFMNFVGQILFQCNRSRMEKFRLKCNQAIDSSWINSWMRSALRHNIQELDLWIHIRDSGIRPLVFPTWKTLVVLKLGSKFVLNVPDDDLFPCLKFLHLDSISFSDDSIQSIFSNSPALEEMSIQGSEWKILTPKFSISSPTLKRLNLDCLTEDEYKTWRYEILLDTPRLVYINYRDYVAERYPLVNLPSLAEAHIGIGLSSEQITRFSYMDDNPVAQIATGISCVQSLYIYGGFLRALLKCCSPLPKFNSLTCLKLEFCKHVGWKKLEEFLKSSPNLETLIFEALLDYDLPANVDELGPLDVVPSCFLNNLESIIIRSFQGKENELIKVEYFLKNAKVLKNMIMDVAGVTEGEQLKITKKLLVLPRASDKCQVKIL